MSYDALRKARYSLQRQAYCITTVTRNRYPLFKDINTARLLVHEIRRLQERGEVKSLARVIMPDHLHWLFQLNDVDNYRGRINSTLQLSAVVITLKARSALTINRHRCCSGSLWQRAYYDHAARNGEDVRNIARYIVANPLRAGLVQKIGDYPHWDSIWMTDYEAREVE